MTIDYTNYVRAGAVCRGHRHRPNAADPSDSGGLFIYLFIYFCISFFFFLLCFSSMLPPLLLTPQSIRLGSMSGRAPSERTAFDSQNVVKNKRREENLRYARWHHSSAAFETRNKSEWGVGGSVGGIRYLTGIKFTLRPIGSWRAVYFP